MRTSWKVGLATGAADPVPRAIPRTNVVLPAPSSPFRRTRSPRRRRRPSSSPAPSVWAGDEVSREVVVANEPHLHRFLVWADHSNLGVACERADGSHARLLDHGFGASAHKLGLLTARERVQGGRALSHGHLRGTDDASAPGELRELLHLTYQAVRDVATTESRVVQAPAFGKQRLKAEGALLTKRYRGGAQRTRDRDRPTRLRLAAGQGPRFRVPHHRAGQHRRSVDRAHVATDDAPLH